MPFWSAIGRKPEQRQALCQSCDGDGRPVGQLPSVACQAQAAGCGDLTVRGSPLDAVGLVAELPRDPQRGNVVIESARDSVGRAEAGEGEVKGGRAHLGADSLAVMAYAEPGEGADLAQDRIVTGRDILLAHDLSISEDGQVKGPVVGGPVTAVPPVALHQRTSSVFRRQARPGDQERPAAWVVHAFGGKVSKVAEFLAGGQANFQAGSGQPKPEKRPVVNEHGGIVPMPGPAVTRSAALPTAD